jgi:hypothetical protein
MQSFFFFLSVGQGGKSCVAPLQEPEIRLINVQNVRWVRSDVVKGCLTQVQSTLWRKTQGIVLFEGALWFR